ncbi:MAG: TolC family protein, partial [Blastochloris sp.]|nr:TolC family protein [Blastochloris sp.]
MRPVLYLALLLIGLSLIQPPLAWADKPPLPPPRNLSLTDAYFLALERSETLGISRQDIKIAEAQYWQAISAILPRIDFLVTERTQNNAGGAIGGGDASGTRKDLFQGRLRISQTIFNGFREFNIGAALQAEKRSQQALYQRSRQLLYLDTSDLFYQILSLEEDLKVLQRIDLTFRERHAELTERVTLGRSRKSELLAAETEQADNTATMEEVRGLLGASRELMAFLIGLPSAQWQLQDTQTLPSAQQLETYLWHSGARPDLQAALETQTSAQRQVSADKGSFWPTISAEANWLALEEPERAQEWNIVLTAEIPVFDGALRVNTLKESQARLRSTELSFTRLRRLAESEVRQNYNNFTASARQWIKLKEAVRISQENVQAQREDYQLGRASNLDVLSSILVITASNVVSPAWSRRPRSTSSRCKWQQVFLPLRP